MKRKQWVLRALKKIYIVMTGSAVKPIFKKIDLFLERRLGAWYYNYLEKLKKRLKYGHVIEQRNPGSKKECVEQARWKSENPGKHFGTPLVSVIVPSYNHEGYLKERLNSIYGQTYQNIEVILLDDHSDDGSRKILEAYQRKYPERTRLHVNEEHCGSIYAQWKKGMEMAAGELIWIAESDDYCEKNLLEKLVPCFAYASVRISFARSVFMQDGRKVGATEEYLKELAAFDWSKSFYMTAHDAVRNGFAVHNLIANVSSMVFRKPEKIPEEVDRLCSGMKLSFDWLFYLNLIRGGSIAYVAGINSYYRLHEESTSWRVQKTMDYYREYEEISSYVAGHYRVESEVFEQILLNLKRHYAKFHKKKESAELESVYSIKRIQECQKKRKWNIIMCGFSFVPGGGETFPVFLANELWEEGYTVTYLNFHQEPENTAVRGMLKKEIPVVDLKSMDNMYWVIEQLGGDIIHTHHALTDEAVGCWMLNHLFRCSQIITLHGIYEMMEPSECKRVLKVVGNCASAYCYVADKNCEPFIREGFCPTAGSRDKGKFVKITNGLAIPEVHPVERRSLGIGEEDFVLVLASRGIPEKGWREAIEAVKIANKRSKRKIRLLILGDGEMRKILEPEAPEEVQFLGVVGNVRDYYAMADAGLVPTTFKGESYPLVIIECIQSQKPVIATDIGEIRSELLDGNGEYAGELLSVADGKVDPAEISDAILRLAGEEEYYTRLVKRCESAARKFDMAGVCAKYLKVYEKAIKNCYERRNGHVERNSGSVQSDLGSGKK